MAPARVLLCGPKQYFFLFQLFSVLLHMPIKQNANEASPNHAFGLNELKNMNKPICTALASAQSLLHYETEMSFGIHWNISHSRHKLAFGNELIK